MTDQQVQQLEERKLILNIRKNVLKAPKNKRAKKAVKVLREKLKRILKTDKIKFSYRLNEFIWRRGIKNPPMKYKLRIIKKEDTFYIDLDDNQ